MHPEKPRPPLVSRAFVIGLSITLLTSYVAYSHFQKSRSGHRGTKATRVLEDLRLIDAAVDQYAIEHQKSQPAPDDTAMYGTKVGVPLVEIEAKNIPPGVTVEPQPTLDSTDKPFAPGSKSLAPIFTEKDLRLQQFRRVEPKHELQK